jgi:hypothetical protein
MVQDLPNVTFKDILNRTGDNFYCPRVATVLRCQLLPLDWRSHESPRFNQGLSNLGRPHDWKHLHAWISFQSRYFRQLFSTGKQYATLVLGFCNAPE